MGMTISHIHLQGMHFQVQSLVSSKYVEEMIPLTNGTFAFKGIFPDIFFTLQVKSENTQVWD